MIKRSLGWAVLAAAWLGAAPAVFAQAADAAGNTGMRQMNLMRIMHDGGSLMWVLAAMSVLLVALLLYLLFVLRSSQVVPQFLQREVIEKVRAGSLDDARKACEVQPCPFSAVVLAALDSIRLAPEAADRTMLKDIVEGEGSRQAEALQGQTQFLLDLAVIAPMVGLLGTIFGMLQAFDAVALNIASAKPILLAAGVSKALLTTAFGLIVGIPAMCFYAVFRRKASNLVSLLEAASTDVFTVLSIKTGK